MYYLVHVGIPSRVASGRGLHTKVREYRPITPEVVKRYYVVIHLTWRTGGCFKEL